MPLPSTFLSRHLSHHRHRCRSIPFFSLLSPPSPSFFPFLQSFLVTTITILLPLSAILSHHCHRRRSIPLLLPSLTTITILLPLLQSATLCPNLPHLLQKLGSGKIGGKKIRIQRLGEIVATRDGAIFFAISLRETMGPFSYGLIVLSVYDNGSVFSPEVLDLTEDDLIEKFALGVSMVTSLSLAISYPTLVAAPHMLINGYKFAL
nr:60S acidic ribosomal protein P0 [Ipomoea batatas]